MAQEIEDRFLLPALPALDVPALPIVQGYLSSHPEKTVRIRRAGDKAWLTVKGPKANGAGDEFEYAIPLDDALRMLGLCGEENTLSKDRYVWKNPDDGHIWEIDNFTGRHAGLVIAELELPAQGTPYKKPAWIETGVDITDDFRFANAALPALGRALVLDMVREVLEKTAAAPRAC
ncbi:MAG: CYTH domain-containing protein [Micavibrio sp.]